MAGTIIRQSLDGDPGPEALWVRVVDDSVAGAPPVGLAIRTPPRSLLLTAMPVPAAEAVCDLLIASEMVLPGVNGPTAASGAFARRWAGRSGVTAHRLFRLGEPTPPTGVRGGLRPGSTEDRDLLAAWTSAFSAEAIPDQPPPDARPMIDARLATGTVWTWVDDGRPVSMLWISPPVSGVVRVSAVYTPPDLRGRGYASACVAAVSGRVAVEGHTCVLFTDLANPASNKIYQATGYRPVMDTENWAFSEAASRWGASEGTVGGAGPRRRPDPRIQHRIAAWASPRPDPARSRNWR